VMEIHVAWPWAGSIGAGRRGCVVSVTMGGSGSTGVDVTTSGVDPSAAPELGVWPRSTERRLNRSLTPTREAYGPDTGTAQPASSSRLTSLSR
jgi:hypothetical protein